MAENKDVSVKLVCCDDKCLLTFELDNPKTIDLYDENINQLKSLFTEIMKDLIKHDIKFVMSPEAKEKKPTNVLAYEVANVYIEKLNSEIESLIQSENLKTVREINQYF